MRLRTLTTILGLLVAGFVLFALLVFSLATMFGTGEGTEEDPDGGGWLNGPAHDVKGRALVALREEVAHTCRGGFGDQPETQQACATSNYLAFVIAEHQADD